MNVPAPSVAVVAWVGPESPNATFGTPMFDPLTPVFGSRTVPTTVKLPCGGGVKFAEAYKGRRGASAELSERPSRPAAVIGASDLTRMKPFPCASGKMSARVAICC